MDFELLYTYQNQDCRFPIPFGECVIGRKEICDLCLQENGVSKRHARIVRNGDRIEIYDAGSRNGTLVNGQAIEHHVLVPGDVIQIGVVTLTLDQTRGSMSGSQSFSGSYSNSQGQGYSQSQGARGGGGFDDLFDEPAGNFSGSQQRSRASQARSGASSANSWSKESMGIIEGDEELIETTKATARLRVFDSGNLTDYDCYPDRVTTIGTKEGNTIVLQGDGISRYHAEVYNDGQDWVVKDLGSRNGIFIQKRGQKNPEKHEVYVLKEGDEIQIGTCRLRFEPLAVNDVDFGKFLKDPRAKPVLAGVIAVLAIILLLPAGKGGSSRRGSNLPYAKTMIAGVKNIQDKNYNDATNQFTQLKNTFRKEKSPALLEEIATVWKDLNKPMVFNWDKAYDLLKSLQSEADRLPKFVRLWVDTEAERIALNRDAFNLLRDGRNTFQKADQSSNQRRVLAAIRSYAKALKIFRRISPKSEFYKQAESRAKAVERKLYLLHYSEGERHFNSGNAEWNEAMSMYDTAQNYTNNPTELTNLRRLMRECIRNHEDEVRYQSAVEIVQRRQWRRYKAAKDLLLAISKNSKIYEDSQAYIEWIKADSKVREATAAYNRGQGEQALRLMDDVLDVEVLGPDARRGVIARKNRWNRVILAYKDGRSHFVRGAPSYGRAQSLLNLVKREERNTRNYYRSRAQRMLNAIRLATEGNYKNLLRQGIKSLKAGKIAKAQSYFDAVMRSKDMKKKYLKGVQKLVEREATKQYLFKKAYKDVLLRRDLKRYQWALDVFRLLKDYLPKSNKSKAEAIECFRKIDRDISRLGDQFEKLRGDN